MTRIAPLILIALFAATAQAKVQTKTVEYKHGNVTLEGYLAWDDAVATKRPGVLVIHEWMGINDHTRQSAERLAAQGYVAFAADIYGKGVRPTDQAAAGAEAGKWKGNRKLLRERARAGLNQLLKEKLVDAKKVAVIGYCFGGTTAVELGLSGAPVAGIVSFHGGLDAPTPADAKNIKGKVLALHGADDPYVPAADLKAFQDELRAAKVDWQLIQYSGAVHAFTNKAAGNDPSKGAAYNETADRRSWEHMTVFFNEIFK
jgi:dienelactone hydrolase